MKNLLLTALIVAPLSTSQMQAQQQPISIFRSVKEHALGYCDYWYGKLYLTRNDNSQKNFIKGFEDSQWWHRYMKNTILNDISNMGANDQLKAHKYLDSILTNDNSSQEVFNAAFKQHVKHYRPCLELMEYMLIKSPHLVDTPIEHRLGLFSPLIVAIHRSDLECVKFLVKHGANPETNIEPYRNSWLTNGMKEAVLDLEMRHIDRSSDELIHDSQKVLEYLNNCMTIKTRLTEFEKARRK